MATAAIRIHPASGPSNVFGRLPLDRSGGARSHGPVISSDPLRFFAMLHTIQDRISREATSIFAARGWRGELGMPDWLEAERRLLDTPQIDQSTDRDRFVVRLCVPGYQAADLTIHVQPDRLYVCGYKFDADPCGQERMVSVSFKLPRSPVDDRAEVSLQDGWLTVSVALCAPHRKGPGNASTVSCDWGQTARAAA